MASGASVSATLDRSTYFSNSVSFCVMAPSSLTNSSFSFQISDDGSTWFNLQSGGSDVTIAAGKAVTITPPPVAFFRLSGASTEGAERTFRISVMVEAGI